MAAGIALAGACPAFAITGGTTTKNPTPWAVDFQGQALPEAKGQVCTGTLIDEQWVLTAKHCVDAKVDGRPVMRKMRIGSLDKNSGGILLPVRQENIHRPDPTKDGDFDLALIRLDHPVPYTPLPLASRTPKVNTQLRMLGWGAIVDERRFPDHLHERSLPLTSTSKGALNILTPTEVGTAQGDSGGPATIRERGVEKLAGVTSSGGWGEKGYTNTFADVTTHRQWINTVLKGTHAARPLDDRAGDRPGAEHVQTRGGANQLLRDHWIGTFALVKSLFGW
ncbi:serine protease [Streptomyces sp. NPDC001941]|uniref:S1 family peptidase n=1 Tax=Streptomyces sp. NPDC001941 TaxID=3154659 RepID=UPI00331D7915